MAYEAPELVVGSGEFLGVRLGSLGVPLEHGAVPTLERELVEKAVIVERGRWLRMHARSVSSRALLVLRHVLLIE